MTKNKYKLNPQFVAYALTLSFIEVMSKETQASNPEDYLSKGIIKTHQDEITEWNEKVELLYRYFCKGLTEVECLREVVHVKGYYADISYKSGF